MIKQPTQLECRCWDGYPNKMWQGGERCQYYECIRQHTLTHKTVCRLKKEYRKETFENDNFKIPEKYKNMSDDELEEEGMRILRRLGKEQKNE